MTIMMSYRVCVKLQVADRIYKIFRIFNFQFPDEIENRASALREIMSILFILVRQAKPGQSRELKGVHLVSCPFDK